MRRVQILLAAVVCALAVSHDVAGNPLCGSKRDPRDLCFENEPLDRMSPVYNAATRRLEWSYATTGGVVPAVCGDGLINGSDQCDGSALPPADTTCTGCNADCTCIRLETCGNSVIGSGETCDPPNVAGTASGCTGTDRCNASCTACVAQAPPICGDSSVDAPEVCDPPFEDGGCGGGDICNATCSACGDVGDGVLDIAEECDPGDRYSAGTDGDPAPVDADCPGLCQPDGTCPPAVCGNGVFEALRGELCDGSDQENNPCPGNIIDPVTGATTPRCSGCVCTPKCGDGLIQTGTSGGSDTDEQCDFQAGTGSSTPGVDFGQAFANTGGWLDTNFDSSGGTALDLTTEEFAIEGFVELDDADGVLPFASTQRFLAKGGLTAGSSGYTLSFLTDGSIRFEGDDPIDTSDQDCNAAVGSIQPNTLYHFALTRDDADCNWWLLNVTDCMSTDTCATAQHTQIDGSDATLFETLVANNTDPVIGGGTSGTNPILDGYVDELRIWSWADGSGNVDTWETAGSGSLDTNWNAELTSATGLVARWDFDQTISTVEETIGGADATANGSTALAASPATSADAGGGSTSTEFGCVAPQACQPNSCRCLDPGTSTGRTFYLDDTGCSNDNDGLSTGAPWCTVAWALGATNPNRMQPGDVLIVRNGTYSERINITAGDSTPMEETDDLCNGNGANALCGTATAPITIQAENSRQAKFLSNGLGPALTVAGAQYYVFDGILFQSADNASGGNGTTHVALVTESNNITFNECGFDRAQRCGNNHLLKMVTVSDVTCDRCEFARHHRHGFSVTGGRRVVCRDCYDNNTHSYGQCPGGSGCPTGCNSSGGPDNGSFLFYPCNNCTVENSVMEGPWGGSINAAPGSYLGLRAADSGFINSIFAPQNVNGGSGTGAKLYSRGNEGGSVRANIRGLLRPTLQHLLVIDPDGIGIRDSVASGATIDRVTVWKNGQANACLLVDDPVFNANDQAKCEDLDDGSSVTVTDSIFTGGSGTEVQIENCDDAGESMGCTGFSGNEADAYTCASECSAECTAGTMENGIPAGIGDTLTNCYHGATPGADLECKTRDRTKLTGTDNSLFCGSAAVPGCASMITDVTDCSAARAVGAVTPCQNGLTICGPVATGFNDGADGCHDYAQRYLRQLADDTQCGGGTVDLLCP